jgi:DNA-binding transcriptional ArsR family regulator
MNEMTSTNKLLDMPTLETLAAFLRVYAHPLRVRIIDYLASSKRPRHVTEIIQATEGAQQAIVSQQLRLLRDSGILKTERRGNFIYYTLAHTRDRELLRCLRHLAIELSEADVAS